MENIYSKFYTGRKDPFGIGTWDSNNNVRRKLHHSNSQPYFFSHNSSNSKNLILPPVSSKYDNGARKFKQYETQTSSITSSYNYDTNKNRKELSNYIKDINKSVANKLQNDNFIAQQKLNNLKNNYNEIKTLLNNKIEKLEHDQQMQFDNLKYALEQGGGLKMMGAVKNANGGNNYNLQRAEEEDIINASRRLPKLLDEQLGKAYSSKKYGTSHLLSKDIRRRVDDELNRQRALDDLKFKRELDEIEAKRENIRQERRRMLRELQSHEIDDLDDPLYLAPTPPPPFPPMYNPYNPYMMPPFPPYFMPPMNNNNNHNDSTGELIKIFLIKKLFDDNKPEPKEKNIYPPFLYQFYPGGFPVQYGSKKGNPIINYPQPLIVQTPYNPYLNLGQGKNKDNESESQKGIPFIDPLEKYLEMVNKAKDTSTNDEGGKGKGNDGEGEDGEMGDEGEEKEDGEGGEGGEDGEEGENGDEEGGGEEDGEQGGDNMEMEGEGEGEDEG